MIDRLGRCEPGTHFYRENGYLKGWNVSPLIQEIDGDVRIYPYVWWCA